MHLTHKHKCLEGSRSGAWGAASQAWAGKCLVVVEAVEGQGSQ